MSQPAAYQDGFGSPIPLTPVVTQGDPLGHEAEAGAGLGKFLAVIPLPLLWFAVAAVVVVAAGGGGGGGGND